ncbi:MAG: hypothetical protein ACUVXJ_18420 [Phycisphaerae bacterium]
MDTNISRRELIGASAGLVAASAVGCMAWAANSETAPTMAGYTKTRVLRIFIGGSYASWPRPDLDIPAEARRLQEEIDKVPGMEDVEFLSNALIQNVESLDKVLEQHKDVDGILGVIVCIGTSHLVNRLADCGRPTVLYATPYSGHEWCIVPDLQRAGKKIDVIPSSNFADAADAIRPFRAIHRLKETRVLFVSGEWPAPADYVKEVKNKFGTEIIDFDHKKLLEVYNAIDDAAVSTDAEQWIRNAKEIREPSKDEITKSARMNLALQKVLADSRAQAITINCLGLFAQKALPAYPCFGFARLNDLGLVGVCEADLPSTMTQIIYLHLTGKPGFVTDPVFDTATNTVIHAHCVSATKMDGPQGEAAPYIIRNHTEDHKGAVLQVAMRIGQEITMAKLVKANPYAPVEKPMLAASPADCYGTGTMLISTGKIVAVPDVDRACRTKIAVKVADARKMFEQWSNGLHRVIFYGNHLADTRRLARFTGFDVVEEG